jgi:hypothetical protein
VSDIPFKSLLALALEPHDLAWTIRHEVLIVTNRDEAEANLVTRVHDVFDLVVETADRDDPAATDVVYFDSLIELIESSIHPDAWDATGGPGAIDGFSHRSIVTLVVSQTPQIQHEISAMLDSLREKKKRRGDESKKRANQDAPREPADSRGVVAYRVFTGNDSKGTAGEQELIEMLKQFVDPESWQNDEVAVRAIPGALVIRHKSATHKKIRQLLSAAGVLQRTTSKKFYDPVEDDTK